MSFSSRDPEPKSFGRGPHRLLIFSVIAAAVLTLAFDQFRIAERKRVSASDVGEATRLIDICLEAGVTMFDSADGYSGGAAEEILGRALQGRRDKALISTKATFRFGDGPNDVGSSRQHLTNAIHGALKP